MVIDRLILPAPIVPREEDCLHGLVVLEALAVGVGQLIEWLPSTTPRRDDRRPSVLDAVARHSDYGRSTCGGVSHLR